MRIVREERESVERRMQKRKSQRRNRKKKKDQSVRKGKKSGATVFSQCFVAPEGPKVGSLKRSVWSYLAGREIKNCTPLRREAALEVKKVNTPHIRSNFG